MAGDCEQTFNCAINSLKNVTNVSGNLKNELKKDILSAIKTLSEVHNSYKAQISELNRKLLAMSNPQLQKVTYADKVLTTSANRSVDKVKKVTFKAIIKPSREQTSSETKKMLKDNLDPCKLKLGIENMRGISNGGVMVECSTKNEVKTLCENINRVCNDNLHAVKLNKMLPRLKLNNIPEEITVDNALDVIKSQNEEIINDADTIQVKSLFKNKRRSRFLIIEVNANLRKLFLEKRIKMGWNVCPVVDHLTISRCYNCNKFGHHTSQCKGTTTCPLCTAKHSLKECTVRETEYSCVNCIQYKYSPANKQVDTNHAALSKACPCYIHKTNIKKSNIDYGL
ncbi:uncharacterized protein [Rhodnius prolixus]|uniref:uncharacterized protein n=1 Tax=Rhodnius prolixus TaxID=13249 RepID=UPI003D18D974